MASNHAGKRAGKQLVIQTCQRTCWRAGMQARWLASSHFHHVSNWFLIQLLITALLPNIINTYSCTSISKDINSVKTIEHIMSAISSFKIDNLLIEIDNEEIPILNGNSYPFVYSFFYLKLNLKEFCLTSICNIGYFYLN